MKYKQQCLLDSIHGRIEVKHSSLKEPTTADWLISRVTMSVLDEVPKIVLMIERVFCVFIRQYLNLRNAHS